ncbi:hypothetical protein FSP39_005850 [Pinctada imbricata]|uniref:BHLH domain-containing protein n=1 Tax=Pinctada imbricata TaxID=66713 RepID=A0AA88YBC2_PINIB|nr:hypothetical protein FSP39_005850 [Pinctada imbricata]
MKTMPKGSVPMRIRRRQSDAKWRASVAVCYDTLKHIIPNSEKMSKRKISKALILQETKKHIRDLEHHLQDILQVRAPLKGKSVLYDSEEKLTEASLSTVRHDFADQQQLFYVVNCNQQRKRSNIPSDAEVGLVNLREKKCPLFVIPTKKLQDFYKQDGDKYTRKDKHKSIKSWTLQDGKISEKKPINKHILQVLADQEETEQAAARICSLYDEQNVPGSGVSLHKEEEEQSMYDMDLMREMTPTKSDFRTDSTSTPRSNVDLYFNSDPSLDEDVTYILPSDLAISPIKLPDLEDDGSDQTAPFSPATLLALQQAESGEYEIDIEDLLCSESIEHMNLEEEEAEILNTHTPRSHSIQVKQRGHKRDSINRGRSLSSDKKSTSKTQQPKCRRKLESVFQEDVRKTTQRLEENTKKFKYATSSKGGTFLIGQLLGDSSRNSVQSEDDHEQGRHPYLYKFYDKGNEGKHSDHSLHPENKHQVLNPSRSQHRLDYTSRSSTRESSVKGHSGRTIQIDDLITEYTLKPDPPLSEGNKEEGEDAAIFNNDDIITIHDNSKDDRDLPNLRMVPNIHGQDSFDKDFCPFDLNSTDEMGFYTLSNGTSSQTSDQLTCSDGGSFSTWSSQLGLETTSSSALSSQVVPEFEFIPIETEFIMI